MVKKKFFKTKRECEVTFELTAGDAHEVALVCEANQWRPIEMKKAKNGLFRTRLRVPQESRVQFRYLVDSTSWINDEAADAYLPNGLGGENGVLFTRSPG